MFDSGSRSKTMLRSLWGTYPDTWKDILEKSQELNDCIDVGKTVAQQQQLFNKNVGKLTQTVSIHIFCS